MKSRLINLVILVVATIFIVSAVFDSMAKENPEDQITYTNSDQSTNNDETISKEASNEAPVEVGLSGGMLAPDFTLPLWETKAEASLSDYRGQIVVLNLWASWCPPCQREMPDLIRFHESYKDQGIQMLSVNLATLERNENGASKFMEEFQVPFPTFVDQSVEFADQRGIVESLYKVHSIPTTYVLDAEGKVFMAIRGEVSYERLEKTVHQLKEK